MNVTPPEVPMPGMAGGEKAMPTAPARPAAAMIASVPICFSM
jgi:hypothetical protein